MGLAGGDSPTDDAMGRGGAVDLYWLPLGAGGHFVRLNGQIYEAVAARLRRRPACDLYHSALQLELPEVKYVIEQAPVHDRAQRDRRRVDTASRRWPRAWVASWVCSGGALGRSPHPFSFNSNWPLGGLPA